MEVGRDAGGQKQIKNLIGLINYDSEQILGFVPAEREIRTRFWKIFSSYKHVSWTDV